MSFYFLGAGSWQDAIVGKKAEHLNLLARAGFNVPPGFVVTASASIEPNKLSEAIEAVGGFPVAVRSSSQAEDLGTASFAGQYETFLNVDSLSALEEKIHECRLQAVSARVSAYAAHVGIQDQSKGFAVLVQRMVPAKIAGVAFSIHPLTGKEEHALIESCAGLGEQLVSGQVSPSQVVLDLRDVAVVSEVIGSQGVRLSESQLRKLRDCLLQVSASFKAPQDIEWAIDQNGEFFLLQSRAITKIFWRTDVEEFTNADFKDGGISARVATPLMLSLYRDALQLSMPKYLRQIGLIKKSDKTEWMRCFYGRGYWNASATKRALANLPGFEEDKFDRDLGIQKEYGPEGPLKVKSSPLLLARAIPVLLSILSGFKKQIAKLTEFRSIFPAQQKNWLRKISQFSVTNNSEFFSDLTYLLNTHYLNVESAYFTTIYNNSNAQTLFKEFIRSLDKKTDGKTDVLALMGGLKNVSHLKIQKDLLCLYHVAKSRGFVSLEWKECLTKFLEEHYFHSQAELEIMTARWGEAPEQIEAMVRGMIESGIQPHDPELTSKEQERLFDLECKRVVARVSNLSAKNLVSRILNMRLRNNFSSKLNLLREFLTVREEMREFSTQTYYVVRLYVLEAGRRFVDLSFLQNIEDVFLYERSELLALVEGRRISADSLFYRKFQLRAYENFSPPNELGKGLAGIGSISGPKEKASNGTLIHGLACSPGVIEAPVRVIFSMEQMGTIRSGEILVTKFTDPGWTPVLGLISGIITEVGGLLSHAAVISRELGIPAILNIPRVTEQLKTGMRIRMDGGTGEITILES